MSNERDDIDDLLDLAFGAAPAKPKAPLDKTALQGAEALNRASTSTHTSSTQKNLAPAPQGKPGISGKLDSTEAQDTAQMKGAVEAGDRASPAGVAAVASASRAPSGGGAALFDAYDHPCVICGNPNAPFGEGWPRDPRFYCREHRTRETSAMLAEERRESTIARP